MPKSKELIELNEAIGRNIQRERQKMKLTQGQMAKLMNLTAGHISLIERGERGVTISNLRNFADIFGIPIQQFFNVEPADAEASGDPASDRADAIKLIERQINRMDETELDFLYSTIKNMRKLTAPR